MTGNSDKKDIIDRLDDKYLIDEGGLVTYDPEGSREVELIYKILLMGQENGEKRDVHNDIIDDQWDLEFITMARLYNDIINGINNIEKRYEEMLEENPDINLSEAEEAKANFIQLEVADDVILFYSLSHEIVRGLSGDILYKELVDEDNFCRSAREFFRNIDSICQEGLLYYMGVIDEGEKGEIANVRKTRNKVIHDIRTRQYLEGIEHFESMLTRTMRITDKMSMKLGNEPRFDQ